MRKTIISDTSCLIILSKIDGLDILHKVYGEILTTSEVIAEYGLEVPEWIKVADAIDKNILQVLSMQVDIGEASALALALESGIAQ